MCKLMKTADMPSLNAKGGNANKQFISMFLKPNNEGENYRFRLLWYTSGTKNDRKTAYFCQYVHNHWGTSAKGAKIVDDIIVCPSTKYVHYDEEKFVLNEKTGKKQLNCPICMKSAENFAIYKNSGNTDKIALKKAYALKSSFRGIIPVYVVNDPNNSQNNGKLKVLILTNQDEFERFNQMVEDEKAKAYLASKNGHPYEIANGDRGVDFCIHMEAVEVVENQGTSKEYTHTVRKITNMAFYPADMAYPIPTLTQEYIATLDMDEQYYISNTKEELQDFYTKYYGCDEVAVPGENIDIFAKDTPTVKKVETENTAVVPDAVEDINEVEKIDVDEIVKEDTPPEPTPVNSTSKTEETATEDGPDLDKMWDELNMPN